MDIATVGGLMLGLGAIIIAYLAEGGSISAILKWRAMLLVIGGTIGASTITTSFKTLMTVPKYLKIAFFGKSLDPSELIDRIVKMAERARRDGILELEGDLKTITNPFFKKAIQLIIDGTEVTVLREILETEMSFVSERHKKGILLFQKMGGLSPTLGILGTILYLISTLANTEDASKMAGHIASALIATLWGIGLANLVYLPLGDKLKHRHEEEMVMLELITEGALSIQSGDSPRVIRTKLLSFVNPSLRKGE
ncbi:MAG TPA: MotA/TolQ/ExbB proton channel family protein [candidate division Zixibacteria bacterium]